MGFRLCQFDILRGRLSVHDQVWETLVRFSGNKDNGQGSAVVERYGTGDGGTMKNGEMSRDMFSHVPIVYASSRALESWSKRSKHIV